MKFNLFLHVYTFLSLALAGSYAVVTPETYWKSVLPNSHMPKAVKDLLYIAEWTEGKNTARKGGVAGDTGKPGKGTNVGFGKGGVAVHTRKPGKRTDVGVGKGEVAVHTRQKGKPVYVGAGVRIYDHAASSEDQLKGKPVYVGAGVRIYDHAASSEDQLKEKPVYVGAGVRIYDHAASSEDQLKEKLPVYVGAGVRIYDHAASSEDQLKEKPVYVGAGVRIYDHAASSKDQLKEKPVYVGAGVRIYDHGASKDQLKDIRHVAALYFVENDLLKGTGMNVYFMEDTGRKTMFLPRQVADSIPFSSNKLPEILNKFSIKPDSMEAQVMKQTLSECEKKGIEGEEKYRATSLESMVDFSTTKLGKKVKAISTEVNTEGSTSLQKYTIEGAKKLAADKAVVCHRVNYAYAIFYCHKTVSTTRAYAVSLVGSDGTKAKVVAVCHTDTTKWNPKHLAFQELKVKPGSVPICHFLPEDNVVWVPY